MIYKRRMYDLKSPSVLFTEEPRIAHHKKTNFGFDLRPGYTSRDQQIQIIESCF